MMKMTVKGERGDYEPFSVDIKFTYILSMVAQYRMFYEFASK